MNISAHRRSAGERFMFPVLLVPAAMFGYTWFQSSDTFPWRAFPFIIVSMVIIGNALDTLSPKISKWKGIAEITWAFTVLPALELGRSLIQGSHDNQIVNIATLALIGFSVSAATLLVLLNRKASLLDTDSERIEDKERIDRYVSMSTMVTLVVAAVLVGPGALWMTGTIPASLNVAASPMVAASYLFVSGVLVAAIVRATSSKPKLSEGLAPKKVADPGPSLEGRYGYDKNGLKKDVSGHTYGSKGDD